jgi:hypothetical protein
VLCRIVQEKKAESFRVFASKHASFAWGETRKTFTSATGARAQRGRLLRIVHLARLLDVHTFPPGVDERFAACSAIAVRRVQLLRVREKVDCA